jgi:hypothetical protein
VTLGLAALIVSGLTLVWTAAWSVYTHRRATRPRVTVRASWGFPTYDLPGGRVHIGERTFTITATNTGQAAVTISGCKFLVRGTPRGTSVVPIDWVAQTPGNLPVRLDPGDPWTGMVDVASVKASLDRHYGPRDHWHVRPVLSDSADRTYRTRIARSRWKRFWPTRSMKLD